MPTAQCAMVDRETKEPCQTRFELGTAVRRKVRGVSSNICDPHALPSVERRATRTRSFLKQLSQTQPDINWDPLRKKARTAGKLVEDYEESVEVGKKPRPGSLRTADDFAVEADKGTRRLLIDTRLAQIQAVLARDPVVVPIHTDDPEQIAYFESKQRRLNANLDKIRRSAEQLARNVEALDSGDLQGINWWNTFRDSFASAVEIYPWVAAYERGEESVNKYLTQLADQTKAAAAQAVPPEEEGFTGEDRPEPEVTTAEAEGEEATAEQLAAAETPAAPEASAEAPAEERTEAPRVEVTTTEGVVPVARNEPIVVKTRRGQDQKPVRDLLRALRRSYPMVTSTVPIREGEEPLTAEALERRLREEAGNGGPRLRKRGEKEEKPAK